MNKVILYGNLGRDPEVRYNNDLCICNLALATSDRRKVQGEWTEHTEWHRVVIFGKRAEAAANYLKKGSSIIVEGKIQTKKYTDKDGVEKYSTDIVCDNFEFAGGGKASESNGAPRPEGAPEKIDVTEDSIDSDEVPF